MPRSSDLNLIRGKTASATRMPRPMT